MQINMFPSRDDVVFIIIMWKFNECRNNNIYLIRMFFQMGDDGVVYALFQSFWSTC